MCPMKRNPLALCDGSLSKRVTIVGIIALLNGFCTAQAQTCTESLYLLPPAASLQPLCVTTPEPTPCDEAKDAEMCPTMVGLCDCETKGLREKVRRECPFMCGICTTTTSTTTTTTIPPYLCEDKDICPTKYGTCDCAHKCENPIVGPRLRRDCPRMCGVCVVKGTPKPTTTTTTTFTTLKWVPSTCVDDESCPSRSEKACDCEEKCRHPIVGAHLTQICPLMCGTCTTTTTTTTTSRYACVDDSACPQLVDEDGIPLCNCDSIGDLVRASCPVMCDLCDRCLIPRISENLANKTSLTKEGNQMGACDDPRGIPRGHTCFLKPPSGPASHPCFSGSVGLYCPIEVNQVSTFGVQPLSFSGLQYSFVNGAPSHKLQVHCRVCGGVTSRAGDTDIRAGHIEVQLSWGPNILDGIINEAMVSGYAVYAVNDCRERHGKALATITALGIKRNTEGCCNMEMYKANVPFELPKGVTRQSFMVVPLTSIGPLDEGWVTYEVADFVKGRTSVAISVASAEKSMKETHMAQEVLKEADATGESKVEVKTIPAPVLGDVEFEKEDAKLGEAAAIGESKVEVKPDNSLTETTTTTASMQDYETSPTETVTTTSTTSILPWLIPALLGGVSALLLIFCLFMKMKAKRIEKEAVPDPDVENAKLKPPRIDPTAECFAAPPLASSVGWPDVPPAPTVSKSPPPPSIGTNAEIGSLEQEAVPDPGPFKYQKKITPKPSSAWD